MGDDLPTVTPRGKCATAKERKIVKEFRHRKGMEEDKGVDEGSPGQGDRKDGLIFRVGSKAVLEIKVIVPNTHSIVVLILLAKYMAVPWIEVMVRSTQILVVLILLAKHKATLEIEVMLRSTHIPVVLVLLATRPR